MGPRQGATMKVLSWMLGFQEGLGIKGTEELKVRLGAVPGEWKDGAVTLELWQVM